MGESAFRTDFLDYRNKVAQTLRWVDVRIE